MKHHLVCITHLHHELHGKFQRDLSMDLKILAFSSKVLMKKRLRCPNLVFQAVAWPFDTSSEGLGLERGCFLHMLDKTSQELLYPSCGVSNVYLGSWRVFGLLVFF